jgi:hypothetical protein
MLEKSNYAHVRKARPAWSEAAWPTVRQDSLHENQSSQTTDTSHWQLYTHVWSVFTLQYLRLEYEHIEAGQKVVGSMTPHDIREISTYVLRVNPC